MSADAWKDIAIQIPVVTLFVVFVLFLSRDFLRELARRDNLMNETLKKMLDDMAGREEKRDHLFTRSISKMQAASARSLMNVAKEVKALGVKLEVKK